MNSKVLDESIAESLQTLDLMCFSEQYYFLVALISFGMLLVTICVEIKLLRRVPPSPRRLLDGVEAHKSTWRTRETSAEHRARSTRLNGLKIEKETTHFIVRWTRVASMA